LTEDIDCPDKPTSRDPIYVSFRSSVDKTRFILIPSTTASRNLTISHDTHHWSGECSLIILPSINHLDHFGYSLPWLQRAEPFIIHILL